MTDHPNELVTASYLDGGLEGEALESFETHLAQCAVCRAGIDMLVDVVDDDLGEAAPATDEQELAAFQQAALGDASPTTGGSRRAVYLLVAAGLAAVALLAAFRFGGFGNEPNIGVERNGGAVQVEGLSPAPGSVVAASELTFRFDGVEGADRYIITLRDSSGVTVATFEVREPDRSVAWPSDKVTPTGTLLWTVRAMALDRTIEETRPIEFEVQ